MEFATHIIYKARIYNAVYDIYKQRRGVEKTVRTSIAFVIFLSVVVSRACRTHTP